MAKKKGKRYSPTEKEDILSFVESKGRGGLTAAVKKFNVTAATIISWRSRAGGGVRKGSSLGKGASKELRALENLRSILLEIYATESKLADLNRKARKARAKI